MNENLIAQIRAYSEQLADAMLPVEPEHGIKVVNAEHPLEPEVPSIRSRWVFALAVAITVLLLGLAVSLLRSSQVSPVATSNPPLPVASTVPSQGSVNGWVAFGAGEYLGDHDIFLVREGRAAQRIIGSDSDFLDQRCPAFSPDGARLAYGQAEGTAAIGYSGAALVVSNIDSEGHASVALEIDVGEPSAPPCAIWSPDGERIAIGIHEYVSGRPQGPSGEGDVWIVDLESGQTAMLPEMYVFDDPAASFPDLEWSPDSSELAIAHGNTLINLPGSDFTDRRSAIILYSAISRQLRFISGTESAGSLTWSPNDNRIAFLHSGGNEQAISVIEVHGDGNDDYQLASGFGSMHGIGPVWSPTGDRIVYQRTCRSYPSSFSPAQVCREEHEVVLVNPNGGEVVLPYLRLPGADETRLWWPFRVTWSPDGQQLLYLAWGTPPPGADWTTALIAVPIDSDSPPVLLYEHPWIDVYEEGFQLGFQSWGPQPVSP